MTSRGLAQISLSRGPYGPEIKMSDTQGYLGLIIKICKHDLALYIVDKKHKNNKKLFRNILCPHYILSYEKVICILLTPCMITVQILCKERTYMQKPELS